jgi:uncharacterized protein YbjT (DUF2867 family)
MADQPEIHAITGAFGYTGRFICHHLLDLAGKTGRPIRLRTLTNSPNRRPRQTPAPRVCPTTHESPASVFQRQASLDENSTQGQSSSVGVGAGSGMPLEDPPAVPEGDIEVFELLFDDHDALVRALTGVSVLYNTYWVRFSHNTKKKEHPRISNGEEPSFSHGEAVDNTLKLFAAASAAGVKRIVHVSISNPELSELPYFRGKLELERSLQRLGVEYSILRPGVLFGAEDILVNNIAWTLRHFPFTFVPTGNYRMQPIHVDDFGHLLALHGTRTSAEHENAVWDAVGPEALSFYDLNKMIGREVCGRPALVIPVPHFVMMLFSRLFGFLLNDQILTDDEVDGLTADLLVSRNSKSLGPAPEAVGDTALTAWVHHHRHTLGLNYASELARRRNREKAYADLYEPMPLRSGKVLFLLLSGVALVALYALVVLLQRVFGS